MDVGLHGPTLADRRRRDYLHCLVALYPRRQATPHLSAGNGRRLAPTIFNLTAGRTRRPAMVFLV